MIPEYSTIMKIVLLMTIIIVDFLILLSLFAKLGEFFFQKKIRTEIKKIFADQVQESNRKIVENDLEKLPLLIQKWLRFSGVIGKQKPRRLILEQLAKMRLKPNQNWLPAKAEQFFRLDEPAFIWKVKVRMFPFFYFSGRDILSKGKGNMLIKLLSLIPIVNAKGKEIDKGTMQRYLAEMVWFPTAALNSNIDWKQLDEYSALAQMKIEGQIVEGNFYFDEFGRPKRFQTKRYRKNNKKYELCDWQIDITEFGEFEGYTIPVTGEVTWKLAESDFTWFKFEIVSAFYE